MKMVLLWIPATTAGGLELGLYWMLKIELEGLGRPLPQAVDSLFRIRHLILHLILQNKIALLDKP